MLHFLLSLALCIFIGERLWHYASAWRLRRAQRRYMALLYPPEPPLRAAQFTRHEPEARAADQKALRTALVVFVGCGLFLILRISLG